MAADIPTTEPAELRAGDTWKWTKTLADYAASAGWTLKYRFKNASAGFEITASAAGDDYSVTVAAATTTAYAAGSYDWIGWVEGGSSEKYTVGTGVATVLPDLRSGLASAALDARSHARKALAAIEAWIESRDPGVGEYEIAGRRMNYIPLTDLLKLRQHYKAEVAAEDRALKIARGESVAAGRIQFRLCLNLPTASAPPGARAPGSGPTPRPASMAAADPAAMPAAPSIA